VAGEAEAESSLALGLEDSSLDQKGPFRQNKEVHSVRQEEWAWEIHRVRR